MGGQFFMAKYSFEFKLQVVQAYLNGEGSYTIFQKNMKFLLEGILENG